MDMLADGAAFLLSELQANASVVVTYRRGSDFDVFKATIGTSLLKITDPGSGVVKMLRTDRDFIFPALALTGIGVTMDGLPTSPAKGDFIDEADPSGLFTRRYEVLPPGRDEPAWRYSDRQRTIVRAHCKFKGCV